ncbi:MAG: hypothetical protein U5R48_19425 [Gammaproteobacteria bacterium]|nr:hypothetical protein [Gammaproteobacteria bacterium]
MPRPRRDPAGGAGLVGADGGALDQHAAVRWLCLGLLATSLRPRLLFRRWNDSSEWPRPETVRGHQLVGRILINIGVTLVLLGALVKLFTLI